MLKKLLKLICVIIIFAICTAAQARVINADWELRQDFEKLISCGVVKIPFYGQRLWTTEQVAEELLQINLENSEKISCPRENVERILSHFENFLDDYKQRKISDKKIYIKPIDSVKATYKFISGGDSTFQGKGVGDIDANINTFQEFTSGKSLGSGHNFYLMSDHEMNWGKQDFFIQPLIGFVVNNEFTNIDDYRATIHQGYAVFNFWKLSAVLGRAPVIWGQGEFGGQIFSENARPLDHLQLTNTETLKFPWIFKYLGDWKLSFVFGNLGPEQFFPWTFFSGLSIGVKPIKNLEFNVHHVIQFGGEGSPPLSFSNGLQEFFGFVPYLSQTAQGGSNKITSLSMRFFIPSFMGMQGYFDYMMDDFNSGSVKAFEKHFSHNSSYLAGLYFVCFSRSCKDSVRMEYANSSPIAYRHSEFDNGWTINRKIIGDPLGPDGQRVLFVWDHEWNQRIENRIQIQWLERADRNYEISSDGLTVTTTFDGPGEKRFSVILGQDFTMNDKYSLYTDLGYELIQNYQFVLYRTENSFLVNVALKRSF